MLGRRSLLLPTALLTLLVSHCVDARPYDFLDNYRDPPLSPEKGPPASANASRDKSLLPAQICGVVAGYVVTVLIWGVLLLTVGRRMRRKSENSPRTLELSLLPRGLLVLLRPHLRGALRAGPRRSLRKRGGAIRQPLVRPLLSFNHRVRSIRRS